MQNDLADGMAISSEKAMELVAVYPELLASATASAYGQIQLDQAVVSAFMQGKRDELNAACLLYTSPSPRDGATSRMPSSA